MRPSDCKTCDGYAYVRRPEGPEGKLVAVPFGTVPMGLGRPPCPDCDGATYDEDDILAAGILLEQARSAPPYRVVLEWHGPWRGYGGWHG